MFFVLFACTGCLVSSAGYSNEPVTTTQLTGSVSGTGSQVKRITLNEGAVVFQLSINQAANQYGIADNFIVFVKDASAQNVSLLVNEIESSYSETAIMRARYSGQYFLDIECAPHGYWTIRWE